MTSDREGRELLVCGLCGRVNPVTGPSDTRSSAVRCTGCGAMLRHERVRKTSATCPACQKRLEIHEDWVGQTVRCGSCGHTFLAESEGGSHLPGGGRARSVAFRKVEEERVAEPAPDTPEGEETGGKVKVRRRRRKKRKVRGVEVPWGLIVGSLLSFSVIGTVIGIVGKREGWWMSGASAAIQDSEDPLAPPAPAPPSFDARDMPAIQRMVGGFLAAEDFDGQMPYVRFQGSTSDRLRAYKGNFTHHPMVVRDVNRVAEDVLDGRAFARIEAVDASGRKASVVVERCRPGEILVDWDSYVRYGTADWASFSVRRPEQPEQFRLFLRRHFEAHPSYPVDQWNMYLAFWKSEEDGVPVFVLRNSPEDERLRALTDPSFRPSKVDLAAPPPGASPVTLALFFPKKSNAPGGPPALEVAEIKHAGWLDPRPGGSVAEDAKPPAEGTSTKPAAP